MNGPCRNYGFVLPSNKIGGGNRVLVSCADHFIQESLRTKVFYIEHKDELLDPGSAEKVKVKCLGNGLISFLTSAIWLSFKIRKTADIDTIIVSDPIMSVFSFIYKNKKLVRYVQSDDYLLFEENQKVGVLVKRVYQALFLLSQKYKYDLILFNSKFSQRSFLKTCPHNMYGAQNYVINPPVFTTKVQMPSPNTPDKHGLRICIVTSKHIRKGFDFLRDVIKKTTHKDIHFLVISQDDMNFDHSSIQYAKPKNDAEYTNCLLSCNIIMNTSRFEGFGLPLLEGMALGLAPISVRNQGLTEYDDGSCISLISNVDEFDRVVDQLRCKKFYEEVSKTAKRIAHEYSNSRFVKNIIAQLQ